MDDTQQDTQTTDQSTDQLVTSAKGDVMQIMDLEKTIKIYHAGMQMKREEVKKMNEMIQDTLENDAVYHEQDEKVKEAKAVQNKTREQLLSVSSIIEAMEEIKEIKAELKEMQKMFSQNLTKYAQVSKAQSITMDNGETFSIETSAKLVKQGSQYRP